MLVVRRCSRVDCCFRFVLLPGFHCELQPGAGCAFQVHPGCLQDWADQGSGAHLSWEQLLRSRACQELPQGLWACLAFCSFSDPYVCFGFFSFFCLRSAQVFPEFLCGWVHVCMRVYKVCVLINSEGQYFEGGSRYLFIDIIILSWQVTFILSVLCWGAGRSGYLFVDIIFVLTAELIQSVCVHAGSQADRPTAADHRLWPLWLCARPCALPVSQQPAEVHWDLRTEGMLHLSRS